MSKNLFKKGLAFGAVLALGVSGFTSVTAASAATGDVTLAPNAGTKYGAFSTDAFTLKSTVRTAAVAATTLAYRIDNPDQQELLIDLGNEAAGTIKLQGYNSIGQAVAINSGNAITAFVAGSTAGFNDSDTDEGNGKVIVDFEDLAITSLVVHTITGAAASNTIAITPVTDAVSNYDVRLDSEAITPLAFGDGDVAIDVTSWVEVETTPDYSTVDATHASAKETVTFYDPKSASVLPRIERLVDSSANVRLNDAASNGNLAGSIEFTKPVNLDQVDLAKWNYNIAVDGTAGTNLALTSKDVKLSGYTTHDSVGRIYVYVNNNGSNITLDVTKNYAINVASTGTGATVFSSVAYTPAKVTTTAVQVQGTVTDGDNAIQTDANDLSVQLRSGTKAFTYKAQILSADATALEAASVPVIALVKANSYVSTGGSYTVSGALNTITKASGVAMSSGYTDSKGQYSVTVTSATAATSEGYTVSFYVLKDNDTWTMLKNTAPNNAAYVATYEAAAATTLVPESTVLAGSSVTAKFTVKDQFGKATAVNGTKALSIELQAANSTNLDKDAVVAADGTASFTFTNYVTSGSSDVLTAKVYTGSASVPTFLGGALTKTLSLYNPGAASAVNASATLSTTITYDDFITGTANTTTNVAPNDGSVALTGTVVDANGTGIPGAVVTIAGKGLQLQKSGGTDYYLDTITVAADAAGAFNVNVFAHEVNTTGSNITITAGGKTATTVLKTYFPATLVNGNNLVFSWKLPALLVKNTTYAVTAKLADKWGNPVATTKNTADAVSFQGTGSVEVNSVSTAVTKNFDKTGSVTVFVRSVKDIAGPGSVSATLNAGSYYKATSSATDTALAVTEITTNDTATKWDETAFKNSLESNVEILDKKPTASISKAATSTVVVKNANGTTIKVVRGTKSKTVAASSNSQKVTLKGGSGSVKVYVNGVLVASK